MSVRTHFYVIALCLTLIYYQLTFESVLGGISLLSVLGFLTGHTLDLLFDDPNFRYLRSMGALGFSLAFFGGFVLWCLPQLSWPAVKPYLVTLLCSSPLSVLSFVPVEVSKRD